MFRFIKSKVSELTNRHEDDLLSRILNALELNANVDQWQDFSQRPPCLQECTCLSCTRVRTQAQLLSVRPTSSPHSGSVIVAPRTESHTTANLPSQESIISALYGANQNSAANNNRFPQDAVIQHTRRNRSSPWDFEGPPAPPYSLVDPEPELSAPLRNPGSGSFYYVTTAPPAYAETNGRRIRPTPLIQI